MKIVLLVVLTEFNTKIAEEVRTALTSSYGNLIDHVRMCSNGDAVVTSKVGLAMSGEIVRGVVKNMRTPHEYDNMTALVNTVTNELFVDGATGVIVWKPQRESELSVPELERHLHIHLVHRRLKSELGISLAVV